MNLRSRKFSFFLVKKTKSPVHSDQTGLQYQLYFPVIKINSLAGHRASIILLVFFFLLSEYLYISFICRTTFFPMFNDSFAYK